MSDLDIGIWDVQFAFVLAGGGVAVGSVVNYINQVVLGLGPGKGAAYAAIGILTGLAVSYIVVEYFSYEQGDEERKSYALEAEPTTFDVVPDEVDGESVVEVMEETATGDEGEYYYTERDATNLAESILETVNTDSEREVAKV